MPTASHYFAIKCFSLMIASSALHGTSHPAKSKSPRSGCHGAWCWCRDYTHQAETAHWTWWQRPFLLFVEKLWTPLWRTNVLRLYYQTYVDSGPAFYLPPTVASEEWRRINGSSRFRFTAYVHDAKFLRSSETQLYIFIYKLCNPNCCQYHSDYQSAIWTYKSTSKFDV